MAAPQHLLMKHRRSWRTWVLVVLLILTTVASVASAKKKKGKNGKGKGEDKNGKGKGKEKKTGRKNIDLHKLSEEYDAEDPEEEEVWETKSEKKRRLKREARGRGGALPPDGEKMDPAELQELIKGASMGGGGMGGMMGGGMGGGASIKTMTASLVEGTCDGSLPPQTKEEPMEGKACAEKIMKQYSAVVATGGIPSVMHMANDNSTIMYVYSGLDKILQMGQMREFLLTRDEVEYVTEDTTRYWPDGRKAEYTTAELRAENQARKEQNKGPKRKVKKKEVEKLKAAEEIAKERRQKIEKERQLEQQSRDLEAAEERLAAAGDDMDEEERKSLEADVERLTKAAHLAEADAVGLLDKVKKAMPPVGDKGGAGDDEL